MGEQDSQSASGTNPNLLIVTIDTLRADHLSCYGSRVVLTPNIDSIAAGGLRFRRALSPVPLTLPSHASLFTGMDPLSHAVRNNGTFVLDSSIVTLAEVLLEQGYRTGAFVGAIPVDSRFGLGQGFQVYDDDYPGGNRRTSLALAERPAPEVIDRATAWLANQTDGGRWFGWIHLYDPHAPYAPPVPFAQDYASDLYAGEIAFVDQVLGGLFDFLRERGLLDDTWIILTSDHGEGCGDQHLERGHGIFTYHSTLWVPLLFRYPAMFAASTVIEQRVRLIDIMPTVLDYLGLPIPERVQGESLRPLIEGAPGWKPGPLYFESLAPTLNFNWASPRGLYVGKYKYIELPLPELYDIEADFDETENLVERQPDVVAEMRRAFEAKLQSSSSVAQPEAVDRHIVEKLRALGYAVSQPTGSVSTARVFGEEDDPKRLIDFMNQLDDARTAYHEGQLEKSIELYRKLIERRADFILAYESLAHIYGELGRHKAAVEVLEAAYRNNLESETVLVELGTHLREAGRLDRAQAVLESALEQFPGNVDARIALGMTYDDLGRTEDAKRVFENLLREEPSSVVVLNNLGAIYLDRKQYDLALAQFRAALQSDPRDPEALNGMGVAYASSGRAAEAVRAWESAVGSDPKRYDTLLNLSFMLLQLKRYDEAARYMQRFVETAPYDRYEADLREVGSILSKLRESR